MTEEEARRIVVALREGVRFATRLHKREWSLETAEDGRFRKWTCEYTQDGRREDVQMMSEREVVDLLVQWYRYDVMVEQLR